jgi:hypothetical protein
MASSPNCPSLEQAPTVAGGRNGVWLVRDRPMVSLPPRHSQDSLSHYRSRASAEPPLRPFSRQSVVAESVASPVPPVSTAAKKTPATPAGASGDSGSIRVSVEKVDQMINLVGELVITQAMLTQAASNADPVVFERLINGLAQLERNTRDPAGIGDVHPDDADLRCFQPFPAGGAGSFPEARQACGAEDHRRDHRDGQEPGRAYHRPA